MCVHVLVRGEGGTWVGLHRVVLEGTILLIVSYQIRRERDEEANTCPSYIITKYPVATGEREKGAGKEQQGSSR